jgi:hypothetical protein
VTRVLWPLCCQVRYVYSQVRYVYSQVRYVYSQVRYVYSQVRYVYSQVRYVYSQVRYVYSQVRYVYGLPLTKVNGKLYTYMAWQLGGPTTQATLGAGKGGFRKNTNPTVDRR